MLFVKERANYPHAKINHALSHLALSEDSNLLRLSMAITNTGTSRLEIKKMLIRVQQILPAPPCADKQPCAVKQFDQALRQVERKEDRFSWPLISERIKNWDTPIEIEPSEEDQIDFEFAIPSKVTDARVYSYIRNEAKVSARGEIGWFVSSYYSFSSKKGDK
jgi:hypothetical protein